MRLLLTVFWRAMRGHPVVLWLLGGVSSVLSVLWVLEPLYASYAIDEVMKIVDGKSVPVGLLFAGWIGIFLAINLVQAVTYFIRWRVQNLLLAESRGFYYERLLKLDISHHVRARAGELMKQIDNASDALVDLSRQVITDLPTSILTSVAFYVLSFIISWQLALLTLLLLPFYIVVLSISVWWTRKHYDKINKLWVRSLGRGYDVLANIFTVKSSGAEESELLRLREAHQEGLRELNRANFVWALLEGIGYFMLMRIVLIGVGVYLLVRGEISLGSLFFFQFSFYRLIVPMEMLEQTMPFWNDKLGKLKLAEAMYRQTILVTNKPDPQVLTPFRGEIAFHGVSFSYRDTEAIHDLTLTIAQGEHLALVGHSGAGKSTMAMLLNRFYDVTSGTILIDGTDIRDLDVSWWRRQIGLVLQENIMFNDSILENIRYSRPHASLEEVKDAARRACADEFIERLPEMYDTVIGERGIRLSGGERQRVAIARAILKQPNIVILDEATSALDSKTERLVQSGIRELIAGRTAVIIAHRLSTVRSVDRIAVLERGRLLACAPHEELMQVSPQYREMVELQIQGMLPDS